MTIQIEGPLLFFGGPYSNLQATQALRKVADELSITAENCLCSGDVVAYCGDPAATVDEICDWGCHVVMGNCEESLGFGEDDCGCGFEDGTACDVLSRQWYSYSQAQLNDEQRAWMRALPRSLQIEMNGYQLLCVHASPGAINQFIFPSQWEEITAQLNQVEADVVLAGHSGIPFSYQTGKKLWVNSGAIGMPANDGQSQTWYALITPFKTGLDISFHRLTYDFHGSVTHMKAAGLDNGYCAALSSGMWPSLDVLPDVEKAQKGKTLTLPSLFYNPSDA